MDLTNLKRQHTEIYSDLEEITNMINDNNFENNILDFVSRLNRFAGKIQIHLNSEDKFLYPHLLEDDRYNTKAQSYINEMGSLLDEFIEYKNKYNTRSKVESNKLTIKEETNKIMSKVRERISKEDNDLYKIIL
ncbi:MAG: hemerythrin domain-containing protein [Clostridium sp.]|nr:hemerythrin domain-containing protein [Clostridium sp.]